MNVGTEGGGWKTRRMFFGTIGDRRLCVVCVVFLCLNVNINLIPWSLLALVSTLVVIYIWTQRKFLIISWKLPGPLALPIIGSALDFICKDEELFERSLEILAKYPSPMRVWFGPKLIVTYHKIEHVEKIMSSMKFIDKDKVYKFVQEFDGESLISGSGTKWRTDRRLMTPMFLKKNIVKYFPIIQHHTKILIKKLEAELNQPTFNVDPYIHKCSADFVNESIIGIKVNAQDGGMDRLLTLMNRMYTVVHIRIMRVWLQFDSIFQFTKYGKEHEEGKRLIHGFMKKALNEGRKNHILVTENEEKPKSFLDFMLDILKTTPSFATDEEMVHHLTTMYSASEDTVTTICCFTLVVFGMYPNVQNRVIKEIQRILGKEKCVDVTLEDIPKFTYLDMCIKDVLRLFPIAPFIMRIPSQDVQIGEILIPKGCSTVVCIQSLHRDPELWEKPNEFYPEHFLPEVVAKRNPYAYIPFSAGPRGCLGRPYADMALKILLVTILQHYEIEADGRLQDKRLKTDISVRFIDDMYPIRIKRRE